MLAQVVRFNTSTQKPRDPMRPSVDIQTWVIVTDRIVELRDKRGLSWNKISPEAERLAAELENRSPRRPWEMTGGWSRQKCILAYRRRKAGEDLPPEASHRECRDCSRLLPIELFDGDRQTCQTCAATKSIRRRDDHRQELVRAGLLSLAHASGKELKALVGVLIQVSGDRELAAIDAALAVEQAAKEQPGSKRAIDLCLAFLQLIHLAEIQGSNEPDPATMSDEQLNRQITEAIKPLIEDAKELAKFISRLTEDA